MLKMFNKMAQSTSEYALIFGLVIVAVTGVSVYTQRALKAKIADSADVVTQAAGTINVKGKTLTLGTTGQWEPGYLHSDYTMTQGSGLNETMTQGTITRQQDEFTQRTGWQRIDKPPE